MTLVDYNQAHIAHTKGYDPNAVGFNVNKDGDQAITEDQEIDVTGWTLTIPNNVFNSGYLNTTTGVFTAPVRGYYRLICDIELKDVVGTANGLYVSINGNTDTNARSVYIKIPEGASNQVLCMDSVLNLAVGDTVAIHVKCENAVGKTVTVNDGSNWSMYVLNAY